MSDKSTIARLQKAIEASKNICVFTGAGVSCPSGIPDFRSADGLYRQNGLGRYSPEEMVSLSFFTAHPDLFYEFYKTKMIYPDAQPNEAHRFFARLEQMGKTVTIVTQNVDGLHQMAGNTKVAELHGSVHRNYCTKCHRAYGLDYILNSRGIPVCQDDGCIIKPDVVLYGEELDMGVIHTALHYIENADMLIVAGTSLTVYPAASFIRHFQGNPLVLINKTVTTSTIQADIAIYDDIVSAVRKLKI